MDEGGSVNLWEWLRLLRKYFHYHYHRCSIKSTWDPNHLSIWKMFCFLTWYYQNWGSRWLVRRRFHIFQSKYGCDKYRIASPNKKWDSRGEYLILLNPPELIPSLNISHHLLHSQEISISKLNSLFFLFWRCR